MKIRSRLSKNLSFLVCVFIIGSGLVLGFNLISKQFSAQAFSARDFNPGRIIDDAVFYNKDAMNAQQIQTFLNTIIPWCNTWNSQSFVDAGGNRVSAPYVCLNNYHENPTTGETSFEKGGGAFPGGVSAAQIIYNAAQKYGINPQVLLVMLKKESLGPLTSDNWPTKWQYRYAMGYACPDNGPGNTANCSAEKAGFYKQMELAAWQLKYYKDHPNDYRYKIGWNDIQYSPDISCGTKRVYIENIATLSLYIYTPYVPNDGAIANYPGTSHCGAYGNRNFYMFFREWFGSVSSPINLAVATNDINNLKSTVTTLGRQVTEITPELDSKPRVWQGFENGTVIWTQNYGAKYIPYDSTYSRWRDLGGSLGQLGVPKTNPVKENSTDGRTWQDFENGTIIYHKDTNGWEMLPGPINDAWEKMGGSVGELGKPISNVQVSNLGERRQVFENGVIMRKDSNSLAFPITKEIYARWQNTDIGLPESFPKSETDGRRWQDFENGTVIWSEQTGAWEILGGFRTHWKQLGGSLGDLGKPVSGRHIENNGRRWQRFEKATLSWTDLGGWSISKD